MRAIDEKEKRDRDYLKEMSQVRLEDLSSSEGDQSEISSVYRQRVSDWVEHSSSSVAGASKPTKAKPAIADRPAQVLESGDQSNHPSGNQVMNHVPGPQSPGHQLPGHQPPDNGWPAPGPSVHGNIAPNRQVPGHQPSGNYVPNHNMPGGQPPYQQQLGYQAPRNSTYTQPVSGIPETSYMLYGAQPISQAQMGYSAPGTLPYASQPVSSGYNIPTALTGHQYAARHADVRIYLRLASNWRSGHYLLVNTRTLHVPVGSQTMKIWYDYNDASKRRPKKQ